MAGGMTEEDSLRGASMAGERSQLLIPNIGEVL